jgi:hypothetical protein
MKLCLLMNSDTLVFPIGIIEVSTSRKSCFWIYFCSLHNYWSPSTWKPLVHTAWGEMERCEKCAFQLLKIRKKNQLKHKTKCVTDILLTFRSSSVKDYNCLYVVSTQKTNVYINFNKNNGNLEIFCWQITVYLNPRKSFPICMFVVMASENCDFHIHFTFLQEF